MRVVSIYVIAIALLAYEEIRDKTGMTSRRAVFLLGPDTAMEGILKLYPNVTALEPLFRAAVGFMDSLCCCICRN